MPTYDPRGGYGGGGLVGQSQNWTFSGITYNGGNTSTSVTPSSVMYSMGVNGVTSTGVVLYTPYAASLVQYPYTTFCTGTNYPFYGYINITTLIINPVYCATRYLVDTAGGHPTGPSTGKTDNYQYHYHDGMFMYMFTVNSSVASGNSKVPFLPQAPTLSAQSVLEGPLMFPTASPYPNFTSNYNTNVLSNYYKNGYYTNSDGTIDYFRHPDGHSKIIAISLDGYPIYGPYGYNNSVTTTSGYSYSPTGGKNPNVVVMQSSYMAYNVHSFYSSYFPTSSTVYAATSTSTTTYGNTTYSIYIPKGDGTYYAVTPNQSAAPTTTTSLPSGATTRMPIAVTNISDAKTTSTTTGPTGCTSSAYQYTKYSSLSTSTTSYYVEPDGIVIKQASGGSNSLAAAPIGAIAQDYLYDWNLSTYFNTATTNAPFFLDQYNGKMGPTPDYPGGTYAYYMTYTYPFIFAPTLRSKFTANIGPIPQTTTTYLS